MHRARHNIAWRVAFLTARSQEILVVTAWKLELPSGWTRSVVNSWQKPILDSQNQFKRQLAGNPYIWWQESCFLMQCSSNSLHWMRGDGRKPLENAPWAPAGSGQGWIRCGGPMIYPRGKTTAKIPERNAAWFGMLFFFRLFSDLAKLRRSAQQRTLGAQRCANLPGPFRQASKREQQHSNRGERNLLYPRMP